VTVRAVIFDWGGTLSEFVDLELVDAWRLAARHLDPAHEDEVVTRLVRVEADFWATTASHQRSATLAALLARADGLRSGMLSNTHWPRAFHERFLERDGLAALIDARLYTSEMPFQKPHPSAFLTAAEALGVDARAAVFVGDRPRDDVSGAQSVGMRTVLRPNPFAPDVEGVEPDARIDALPELVDLVRAWQEA